MRALLPILLLVAMAARPALGQADAETRRQGLRGVSSFALDAVVEGPTHLTGSELLQNESLIEAAGDLLQSAGLPVAAFLDTAPVLHIHLNMMQIESGLIAFSIEVDFLEDVFLTRNRQQTNAVTWNESVVGLVSHDRTATILESVLGLVDQFARDYQSVN